MRLALPGFLAHERLMLRLPVRTHRAPDPEAIEEKRVRRRSSKDTQQLNYRIRALKKRGLANVEIAEECGVSPTTVSKHLLGYIKTTNRANGARR